MSDFVLLREAPGLTRIVSPSLDLSAGRLPAREVKFLVPEGVAGDVRTWMRTHLDADPHASGLFGDEYDTRTIYLDTPGLDILMRRYAFGRSKYRIRRYDHGDAVFLERKLRTSQVLMKRRSLVASHDLARLALPDHADDAGWTAGWFSRRVQAKRLGPVCRISYGRTARQGVSEFGPVRITLDCDIRAAAVSSLVFSGERGVRVAEGFAVLEMKYVTAMPAVFKRLLETFDLTPTRLSKYRTAAPLLCMGAPFSGFENHLPAFSHE